MASAPRVNEKGTKEKPAYHRNIETGRTSRKIMGKAYSAPHSQFCPLYSPGIPAFPNVFLSKKKIAGWDLVFRALIGKHIREFGISSLPFLFRFEKERQMGE